MRKRRLSKEYLRRAALHYLQRYQASTDGLRRVLHRRVHTHLEDEGDPAPWLAAVEDLLMELQRQHLLDDVAFARARVATLHRRGDSTSSIRFKLRQKGVSPEHLDDALNTLAAEQDNVELTAAQNFIRRRRLGKNPHTHEKDLACLARAGFSYAIARRALSGE